MFFLYRHLHGVIMCNHHALLSRCVNIGGREIPRAASAVLGEHGNGITFEENAFRNEPQDP